MKILEGNKIKNMDCEALKNIVKNYNSTIIDIGTGDGSFPYKSARGNKGSFYIGLDAVAENMIESAVRAGKKVTKGGLNNVLYVIDNALSIPEEFANFADSMHINLPWGSLRDAVVKGEEQLLNGIRKIGKANSTLDIYVTYSSLYEAKEINSRQLPELSEEYINTELKYKYKDCGIKIKKVELCNNDGLKSLDTSWAKKLAFGRKRDVFHFNCVVG